MRRSRGIDDVVEAIDDVVEANQAAVRTMDGDRTGRRGPPQLMNDRGGFMNDPTQGNEPSTESHERLTERNECPVGG
jgi:hypothetical protein